MKGSNWLRLIVFLVCFGFVLPAFAAEEKAKDEAKIKGATIVEAKGDPGAKLAALALKTDKEEFQLVDNAVAKKMQKYTGSKANVTGKFQEVAGKKVFEAWVFERFVEGAKPRRLPSE